MKKETSKIKYWIVSDTHYGHENVKKYCDRPDGFEEITFENLKKIPEGDVLIHLGDIAFGNVREAHEMYVKPLKCRQVLVRGNHDKKSKEWYLSNGWSAVFTDGELRITLDSGKMVILSHDKVSADKSLEYSYNIFGHIHNKKIPLNEKQIVYSLENECYEPVLLEELINRKDKENESL